MVFRRFAFLFVIRKFCLVFSQLVIVAVNVVLVEVGGCFGPLDKLIDVPSVSLVSLRTLVSKFTFPTRLNGIGRHISKGFECLILKRFWNIWFFWRVYHCLIECGSSYN